MTIFLKYQRALLKRVFFIGGFFYGLSCAPCIALELALKDDNLRNCAQQAADKNHWQTATEFTALECHNQNIASVEGIEQFVNIEKLSLYNNNLSSFPALNLPKLNFLNIAKNKLPQLKLKDYPALESFFAFGNQLSTLDLSNLPNLKSFKANNNQITDFIYKDLPALEKIYMFDNKMVTIDIYRLPKMNYMDVRQNPMPDKLYEDMDKLKGVTFLHNGNTRDWHQ
ncbi:hypothetical protein GCM10011613_33820 [Cellvibrio zantedeschiae]|uniref:Leucine-rich repeat domain-containing protein n=1 Tax=Cellvibrio zantedeschiae TaxID=1237077 RepID=A0ABQ3B9H9_9GAMM|nr:hypothetical protein [Cellvibrio zantedeschiae]GGY86036.1 hypothetical protein GCM10011613_33820 [Cellvibrio zantedeschiae]